MNVAPNYTLDVVEGIVTHPEVRIRGLLLTLKLIEWDLAEQVPEYLDRVRSWGYQLVRARQLQHNRQEVCIAALRRVSWGRTGRRRAEAPESASAPQSLPSREKPRRPRRKWLRGKVTPSSHLSIGKEREMVGWRRGHSRTGECKAEAGGGGFR